MNIPELPKPNRTQALGLVLLVISAFTLVGGWSWVMAYWDHSLVEEYRGYEIHYFSAINIYGINTGGEATTWQYNSGLQGARNMIDSWLDNPEQIETYRDFTIYKITGLGLYYGEGQLGKTANWDNITNLKAFIDAQYYPTLVYTYSSGGEEWLIYRQGLEDLDNLRYWVEYSGTVSQNYGTLAAAKLYAEDLIEAAKGDTAPTENSGGAEDPAVEDPISEAGETEPGSIGAFIEARKLLISAVSGCMGVGLMAIGSVKRDDP